MKTIGLLLFLLTFEIYAKDHYICSVGNGMTTKFYKFTLEGDKTIIDKTTYHVLKETTDLLILAGIKQEQFLESSFLDDKQKMKKTYVTEILYINRSASTITVRKAYENPTQQQIFLSKNLSGRCIK